MPSVIQERTINENCLILALKEKGRDFGCLLSLKEKDGLINFSDAINALKTAGVSLSGLFAQNVAYCKWHVTTEDGTPIEDVCIGKNDLVGVAWVVPAITAAGSVVSSMLRNKQSQGPLETPEQTIARQKLLEFANTGKWGDFTAGEEIPLGYGDYNVTGIEQQGLSQLERMLSGGQASQYRMGDAALSDYLATDPTDVSAQFNPFKQQVERQTKESERALRRSAGVTGNLYSTDQIRNLGDIKARSNETLTAQLANLTDQALNRRLQAIPLAYQSAESQQNAALQKIGASQEYGGLTRMLNDSAIKIRDAELLRRRQELGMPIDAAKSVLASNTDFGVKSVDSSPYAALLNMIGQIGGQYFANKTKTPASNGNK